ncbi:MAG: cell division protein FtsW [Clostridia bacterium]|nr:cell division protein FtsW [Clostridia bacterium]
MNSSLPAVSKQQNNSLPAERPVKRNIVRMIGEVDRPMLLIIVALICIGLVMIFSSSYAHAETRYGDSYRLIKSQLRAALIGLATMLLVTRLDYRIIKKFGLIACLVIYGLNYAVPFIGSVFGGAKRWIQFSGFTMQPSELLKFAVILASAIYISDNYHKISSANTFKLQLRTLVPIGVITVLAAGATLFQNHASATIIMLCLAFAMLVMSNIKLRWVLIALGVVAVVGVLMFTVFRGVIEELVPQVFTRLEVWEDPFAYMSNATGGKGWQPAQSLYAIASGGFWGLGLGQSNQKLGYLPEPYNDYIFAILCEELGLFGAIIVIALFAAFIIRGFIIASRAPDRFSQLLTMGIVSQVGIQVALNLAVVTNTLPSTGIGLPFFSYGGTALIILLTEMGIVLSVSRYSYIEKG